MVGRREAHVHSLDVLGSDEILIGGILPRAGEGGTCRGGLGPGVCDAYHLHLGHVRVRTEVYGPDKPRSDDADPHLPSVVFATKSSVLPGPNGYSGSLTERRAVFRQRSGEIGR